MTAQQEEYIGNINNDFADYGLDLARREIIGLRQVSKKRELFCLLNMLGDAITQYLYVEDDDTAFCEESQAQVYVDYINILTNKNNTYN